MNQRKRTQFWLNAGQKELYADVAKYILKGALFGAMIAVALTSSYLAQNLLRGYNRGRRKKASEQDLEKVLSKFHKDRLVSFVERDGKEFLKITEKGKKQLVEYDIDTIAIKRQRWDGKLRMVIFDIPEKQRLARRVLRDKLKEIGFIKLQKSVWVCPYECKDEISFIASVYEVERFVNYAIVEKIDNSEYLETRFGLN